MNTLADRIRESVIGENTFIETAFGRKPLVYADYTASGRSLSFIEDFIARKVLPYYANTHTETSYTGAQTTALREEARREIRLAVNGGEDDQVIFCGSGATAAIHKLIDILNLRMPADLCDRYPLLQQIPADQRPVVFIGPYEHHSNELPWRESIAELVSIPLTNDGTMDIEVLAEKLQDYSDRTLKIGSFSAASNVTGLKTDVNAVTKLLHRYNALSFWDYAAAGPYCAIDMGDEETEFGDCSKDAVFISPHKFVGGPGTPGILIVKRQLLKNRVPAVPGGGTVVYVSPQGHRYTDNLERREEGGTPAIVESIRAGLVFKLQQAVGTEEIERREHDFVRRAIDRWSKNENIEILGNLDAPRLSIISLRIKYRGEHEAKQQTKDLHYNYIAALLNDLFGIQARGGCSCAGPYGHALLDMDADYSRALEAQLLEGHMVLRPGWIRLNFNYFIGEATFEYLVRALELIADYGWRMLPYYKFDQAGGVWRYQNRKGAILSSLADLDFNTTLLESPESDNRQAISLLSHLAVAEKTLRAAVLGEEKYVLELPEDAENLRWFVLPQEITQRRDF